MAEKWLISPGAERTIVVTGASRLKIGLVGGQINVIASDDPDVTVEVSGVTIKDLRVEFDGTQLEVDHPQLGWDNFLEVFRNFGSGGPKAQVTITAPRTIALNLGVVSAGALISGLRSNAKLNAVSGEVVVDTHAGDLSVNTVSGEVQIRGLVGALSANTVSGDVAVTGSLSRVSVDTVSGSILVDAAGDINTLSLNTVSGKSSIRLDETLPAKYAVRTISGKLFIDGVDRSSGGPTTYSGSIGELAGTFVDVRANSVSGSVTVLRREGVSAANDDEWES